MNCSAKQKVEAVFLTSAKFNLDVSSDGLAQKAVDGSDPLVNYSLLPISASMEQLCIMCTPHILIEANLIENMDLNLARLENAFVLDMTAYSQSLIDFHDLSARIKTEELKGL